MNWSQPDQSNNRGGKRVAIAPSLLAADFSRLEEEVRAVEAAGADLLHLDVMDGHFVPNLTFGPFIVAAIRRLTQLPLDTHLMIENPERYIEPFVDAGSDYVTIHVEASSDVSRDLAMIKGKGAKPGLTLNPDTPMDRVVDYLEEIDLFLVMSVFPGFGGQSFIGEVLGKVEEASRVREERGLDFAIEIDGGINEVTAKRACESGVDILVAGTYILNSPDYKATIDSLRP